MSGHTQYINQVIFNPNSSIIASGDEAGVIKLWNKKGISLITLKASETRINSLRFTDDGLNLIPLLSLSEILTNFRHYSQRHLTRESGFDPHFSESDRRGIKQVL